MSSTGTSPATYAEAIGFPDWRGASEEWRQIKRDGIYRMAPDEDLPEFERLHAKMEDLVFAVGRGQLPGRCQTRRLQRNCRISVKMMFGRSPGCHAAISDYPDL